MRVLCCVCDKELKTSGEPEFFEDGREKISHGLCVPCYKAEKELAIATMKLLKKGESK